jgi:hypothetical protein
VHLPDLPHQIVEMLDRGAIDLQRQSASDA